MTETVKSAYPPAPSAATQEGPEGIRYDFNQGARIILPEGDWQVRLYDLDTNSVVFEQGFKGYGFRSNKLYYVRWLIQVWRAGELVFKHEYDAKDKPVLINFPVGTLGDVLGWFSYAVKFQRKHGCKLSVSMSDKIIPLFEKQYPGIEFLTPEQVNPNRFYATYNIGIFFAEGAETMQPCDFRMTGLHRTAGYILGVDLSEEPPRVTADHGGRPIEEPYVCIATQATTQAKYWNNPNGWHQVIDYLKEVGYRVICIDQGRVCGQGINWNHMPYGAENETGERPLTERARWLKHADFFVGLSSGLSWLAWCVGTPVVMIAGMSHPINEFSTPYRVINYHSCNSCWNDSKITFDHHDFLWCPRHKGTPRQFECSRLIMGEHVIEAISRIPKRPGMAERWAAE